MTQEDKRLLLEDLSARLPYGVICVGTTYSLDDEGENYISVRVKTTLTEIHNYKLETAYVRLGLISSCPLETVKPYLRPMSSMTEKEIEKYKCLNDALDENYEVHIDNAYPAFDWLNAHHIDYRGLIPKGLALEAPENMYKQE